MSEDFVTRLQLQLREAAVREERRTPVARGVARARRGLPGPTPVAAGLAAALLALAVALGAIALRDEPRPTQPKVVDDVPVATGLSSLASGFGSAWATDPNRSDLLRLDPATRRVVARIPVGGEARVATGAGAVWALAGDLLYAGDKGPVRLLRIDPATNRVVARIPMRTPAGARFGPLGVRAGHGVVWVEGATGALRIDPRRNAPDRFVALLGAGAARGAVAAGDRVWTLAVDGRLRELDARTGRPLGAVRVRAPVGARLFGAAASTLMLGGDGRIERLDAGSGRRLWRADLGGDIRASIPDGDVIWAHVSRDSAGRDELVRLDADSGRRLGSVLLPEPGVAGMAKVGPDLWVAAPGGRVVIVR